VVDDDGALVVKRRIEDSVLIDRTLEEIRVNVGSRDPDETTSTEDLRVSFERYREFFQRLLSA
jgi:hypothetical protein